MQARRGTCLENQGTQLQAQLCPQGLKHCGRESVPTRTLSSARPPLSEASPLALENILFNKKEINVNIISFLFLI